MAKCLPSSACGRGMTCDRHELADARRRLGAGLGGRLHRADVAADDDRDEPVADLLAGHDGHVRRLHHGVRRRPARPRSPSSRSCRALRSSLLLLVECPPPDPRCGSSIEPMISASMRRVLGREASPTRPSRWRRARARRCRCRARRRRPASRRRRARTSRKRAGRQDPLIRLVAHTAPVTVALSIAAPFRSPLRGCRARSRAIGVSTARRREHQPLPAPVPPHARCARSPRRARLAARRGRGLAER